MRKLIVIQLKPSDFQSIGSTIASELKNRCYENKTGYEKGYYWVTGKEAVKTFCDTMTAKLKECLDLFQDKESQAEINHDLVLIKALSQTKAS